jgi:hypothetical protein
MMNCRELSGHSYLASRMTLECRRALALLQFRDGIGLSLACLRAILVSQALVHKDNVYRDMWGVHPIAFRRNSFSPKHASSN